MDRKLFRTIGAWSRVLITRITGAESRDRDVSRLNPTIEMYIYIYIQTARSIPMQIEEARQ